MKKKYEKPRVVIHDEAKQTLSMKECSACC